MTAPVCGLRTSCVSSEPPTARGPPQRSLQMCGDDFLHPHCAALSIDIKVWERFSTLSLCPIDQHKSVEMIFDSLAVFHDLRSRALVFDWQHLCAARHLPKTSQLYPLFGDYCWGQPSYS